MSLVWVFACVLVLSFTVLHLMTRPPASDKTIQARVTALHRPPKDMIEENERLVREQQQGFSYLIGERLKNFHFAEELERLIIHAGSTATIGSVALISMALALLSGFLVRLFVNSFPVEVLATIVGGLLRYMALRIQKSRRLAKFDEALPDAIELMARALRAGHSMASSIEVISEQSAEPLKSEFGLCFQQQKFGIPFRDAILAMNDRIPSKDLRFLVTAILVQKETGGDLTEILDRTTHVIRERMRIYGEVRTHTAQGRLTGWILGLMPVFMLLLLNLMTPGYSHVLFADPFGQKLLYAGGTLILIGGLIIRKIVDIKV